MNITAARTAEQQFDTDRMDADLVYRGAADVSTERSSAVSIYLGPRREDGTRYLYIDGAFYSRITLTPTLTSIPEDDMLSPNFGTAETDDGFVFVANGHAYLAEDEYYYEDMEAATPAPEHAALGIYTNPFGGYTVVCTCTQPDDTGAGAVEFTDLSLLQAVNSWNDHAIEASRS